MVSLKKRYGRVVKKMVVNSFVIKHEFLCVLPATAVWNYGMDEIQR